MTAVKTKAEIIAMMRERQKEIPAGVSIVDYHLRSIEIMFDVAATILEKIQDRDTSRATQNTTADRGGKAKD